MRMTIDLPDDLLATAKRIAAESKRPLRAVIEDALREALGRQKAFSAGGLREADDIWNGRPPTGRRPR